MSDIVFGTDGSDGPDQEPKRPAARGRAAPASAKASAAKPAAARPAAAKPAAEPAPASATESPRDDMTRLLGQIVTLLGQSPGHRHVFVSDLEWMVLPALLARQARIWRRQTEAGALPVIYASWALVDEAVEARLRQGQMRLKPNEWRSGDRAWLIDMVAPFGGTDAALTELADQLFPGKTLHALVSSATGGFTVREVKGKPAEKNDGAPAEKK
ncbi:MAG: toxin-activating lysine-acyltransferase [Thalassobaculum sp.]|uniref:toxin-activating lysine-acyltransferase n=1 Tax=Thalassobaculum sp. TaxID=2022740 RepID=UPI0032ED24B0